MGYLSTVPSDEKAKARDVSHEKFISTTVYGSSLAAEAIPRFELGEDEMPARTAMRLVHDELLLVNVVQYRLDPFEFYFVQFRMAPRL
jgi:glutamate decarboxylase